MRVRARAAASTVILEAAEEVAAERGIEATSITAIAERAGVAIGTLYNYFPDRDALLAALFKLRRAELLPRIAAAIGAKQLPFEERLRAYVVGVAGAFEDYRTFCRVAMSVDQSTIRIKGPKSAVVTVIAATLTDIIRPVAREASKDYARMMVGSIKSVFQARIETGEPLRPAAELIVETFLHGIARR